MSFASPAYLALLSLAAAVLLLHMLRTRRRKVMISSTLLWKLAPKELTSTRAIKRFVPNILLMIQLLALTALVLAVAKPVTHMVSASFGRSVIIVDASASMSAVENGKSRLQRAADLVSGLKDGRRSYTVIKAGWEPEVVERNVSKSDASKAVADIGACLGGSNLSEAVEAAKTLLAADRHNKDKIIVISDETGLKVPGADCIKVPVIYGNQAINSFDLRALNEKPGSYRWTANVQNYSQRPGKLKAFLSIDGAEVFSTVLNLRPGQSAVLPQTGNRSLLDSARFNAVRRISFTIIPIGNSTENCLAADDKAYLVLNPFSELRITLIRNNSADKKSALVELLSRIPWVRLSVRSAGSPPDIASSLTIYDGMSPASAPKGKSLIVSALPGFMTVDGRKNPKPQEFTDWDKTSPVLRFMDLTGVTASTTLPHDTLPGAKVLAEGQDSPLIEELDGPESQTLLLAFDPDRSTITGRTAFPIFVLNLLDWAAQPLHQEDRPYMYTGETVDLRKRDDWRVTSPSGARSNPGSMSLLDEAGFYTIIHGETQKPLAVNFRNQQESDVLNQRFDEDSLEDSTVPKLPKQVDDPASPEPLWRPLSILALLLLTAEWLLYTGMRFGRIRRSKV